MYLVSDFREQSAGPVEEVLSKLHFVVVVLVAPFAHSRVLPLFEPFILHHGQYGHATFSCEDDTDKSSHFQTPWCVIVWYVTTLSQTI